MMVYIYEFDLFVENALNR